MAEAPAILLANVDANQIDVQPTSAVSLGVIFQDPMSGRFAISPRNLAAGEFGAAYDSGVFQCLKETDTDVLAVGDTLSFGASGYEKGGGRLTVVEASGSGERYVKAELNTVASTAGSGENMFSTDLLNEEGDLRHNSNSHDFEIYNVGNYDLQAESYGLSTGAGSGWSMTSARLHSFGGYANASGDGTPNRTLGVDGEGDVVSFDVPFAKDESMVPELSGLDIGSAATPWRNIYLSPSASLTPTNNGDLVIEATSDTTLTFKLKGSDGTIRSGTITLT